MVELLPEMPKDTSPLSRRKFLAGAAATGAGLMFLPRTRLFGADTPNNRLNIAISHPYRSGWEMDG